MAQHYESYRFEHCCEHLISSIVAVLFVSCASRIEPSNHAFEIVRCAQYYEREGAIIPESNPDFVPGIPPHLRRIRLSIGQVEQTEKIFADDLYNYERKLFDDGRLGYISSQKDSLKVLAEYVQKELEDFRLKYSRYYAGYIDEAGDLMVSVQLFNMSTIEARRVFAEWRDHYIWGINEFFERTTQDFCVNITKGEIDFQKLGYSSPGH